MRALDMVVVASLLLGLVLVGTTGGGPAQAAVPAGFVDEKVFDLRSPAAIAFLPDGRLLGASQAGVLRLWNGQSLSLALDLSGRICANGERGLLGIAVRPGYGASNKHIYLYYTANRSGVCVNRVSRFVLDGGVASGEVVLIDNIPSTSNANHAAGDLHFGKDGYLYVSIGDSGMDLDTGAIGPGNNNARDPNTLLGKILRVTADGGIPPTNPYLGTDSRRCNQGSVARGLRCQEVFAFGLRNPFRFAFDPNAADTRFFINDTGQFTWEEVNLGQKGADYGWNVREGFCANGSTTNCGPPPAGMTNPVFAYGHGTCNAITAGAFVPNGVWPPAYDGAYLFGDYTCGRIWSLKPSGGSYVRTDFATVLGGGPVAMAFGPAGASQALYYTAYSGDPGQVRRIRYTGSVNRPPVAEATASPTFGKLPLAVSFDAARSSDPDGNPLTYAWDFGDGSASTTGRTVSHTYTRAGPFTATLTVGDGRGGSDSWQVRIDAGNTPPQPTITAPTAATLFRVGQTVTLTGSATDAEEGPLPASALSWEVLLHHDTHVHPFLPPTAGNNIVITTPAPEDFLAATNSYLELRLTATDAAGLKRTISQNFLPRTVDITLSTEPTGLRLEVNGVGVTGPTTFVSWEGATLDINAPDQLGGTGQQLAFAAWSDGGDRAHRTIAPAAAATLTATFGPAPGTSVPLADARVHEASPDTNYGRSTALRAEGGADPDVWTYLRFPVEVAAPVVRATLWLYAYEGSRDGPAVYSVSDTAWEERGLTWANRPGLTGAALADAGAVAPGTWVPFDVTAAVAGNGLYTFALVSTSTDAVSFNSREAAANRPYLKVETTAGDTRPPSPPSGLTATIPPDVSPRVVLTWNPSSDDVGVVGYELWRDGAVLTRVGPVTSFVDTTVRPGATHRYVAYGLDAAGNRSQPSNTAQAVVPNDGSGSSRTFAAVADARVSAAIPTTNYGTSTILVADADPASESYLRFTVANLSGTVSSARLRVFVGAGSTDGTVDGPAVATASSNWTETGITWNTRPPRSGDRDDKGALPAGSWAEWDVTPFVTGNGTFTFVLATSSADGAVFSSRQGANPPQLVVTVGGSASSLGAAGAAAVAPPPGTPAAATPTAGANPTATASATAAPSEAATATASPTPTATLPPTLPFADGFESGDLSAWSAADGLTVSGDEVHTGAWDARARSDGTSPASATRTIEPPAPELFARTRFTILARGENPVTLLRLRDGAGAPLLTFSVDAAGRLQARADRTGATGAFGPVTADEWHEVQVRARVAVGEDLVEVWLDGALVGRFSADLGDSPIAAVQLGDDATGRVFDVAFDDVALDTVCVGACPADLVTPTPAPTATVPPPTPTATVPPAEPTAAPTEVPTEPVLPTATTPPPPPTPPPVESPPTEEPAEEPPAEEPPAETPPPLDG
jgi:glucose/arabinose dehydrogenase